MIHIKFLNGRKIYYIDVGNLPIEKATRFVEECIAKYKKT